MSSLETVLPPPSTFDLLRNRDQFFESIREGKSTVQNLRRAALAALLGSALFGLALGSFAWDGWQILASTLKVPLLLLGTAILCFPTFYILQSWRAPRPLALGEAASLQAMSLAAVALVWGSLAPPLVFLVGSATHYHLSQMLALVVGALGGMVGLSVLRAGYRTLCLEEGKGRSGIFLVLYFLVFAAVGGQLAWMLRPFVGSPNLPFQLFRPMDPQDGNIFLFILRLLFGR